VGRDNSAGKKGYWVLQYGNGVNELGKHYWDDTKRQAGYRMTGMHSMDIWFLEDVALALHVRQEVSLCCCLLDVISEACTKNQLYFYTSLVSDFSECIRLIDCPTPAPILPGTCRACLPKEGATCESAPASLHSICELSLLIRLSALPPRGHTLCTEDNKTSSLS
jgi:hypothetical protein